MYENSLRVPLIVYDPRQSGGKRIQSFALNIDVPATILDLAGIPAPDSWQGASLFSKELEQRKEFLTEHLWQTPIIAPSEAIRTDRWKYFHYLNDPTREELYDLVADPMEKNNLAGNPLYQQNLQELRKKLKDLAVKYQQGRIVEN